MIVRKCLGCGTPFTPRPQSPHQQYCSSPSCQRCRRAAWQRARRHNDPDYRDNQFRAQAAWAKRHPEYWKAYRKLHPEYSARNREQQAERSTMKALAKMDVCGPPVLNPGGLYLLAPVYDSTLWRKMDAWVVRIGFLFNVPSDFHKLQREDA